MPPDVLKAAAPPKRSGRELAVTVLGSGTLVPSDLRRSAAHLVELDDARILLDIGFGTVHGFARHGVSWAGLTHVVISHFHTDHIGDLAPYLFTLTYGLDPAREEPLVLVGPPGFGRVLDGLARAHGEWVLEPPFDLTVVELQRSDRWDDPAGRFRLVCHPTPHTPESVAWRVEAPAGVVGYTGDTGPAPEVGAFLAGTGVMISECAMEDGSDVGIHVSPSQVAAMAGLARPGLLVLTHVYPPQDPADTPHLVRAGGYEGTVVAAADGDRFLVRDNRPVRRSDISGG